MKVFVGSFGLVLLQSAPYPLPAGRFFRRTLQAAVTSTSAGLGPSEMLNSPSHKLGSPSADRNKEPIWHVLQSMVFDDADGSDGRSSLRDGDAEPWNVLEVAAGSGVHMQYFGHRLVEAGIPFRWHPSDPDPRSLASQQAYLDSDTVLRPHVAAPLPLTLDATGIVEQATASELLGLREDVDLIVCINMVHISPWLATQGLMRVAGQCLRPGGCLYLYGPYRVGGACVDSNERFDQWLRAQDGAYGVRNLEDVVDLAVAAGLALDQVLDMPANNLSLLFRKAKT